MAQAAHHGNDDEAEESAELDRVEAKLDRALAEPLQEGLPGRHRRAAGLRRSVVEALGDLLDEGSEGVGDVFEVGDDPPRRKRVLGPQHQPGAGGIQPVNGGEVDADRRSTGSGFIEAAESAVERRSAGDEPGPGRLHDQPVALGSDQEACVAGLHGRAVYTLGGPPRIAAFTARAFG